MRWAWTNSPRSSDYFPIIIFVGWAEQKRSPRGPLRDLDAWARCFAPLPTLRGYVADLNPSVARFLCADFCRRPKQRDGALDADQGQHDEPNQFADFQRARHLKTIERVVE